MCASLSVHHGINACSGAVTPVAHIYRVFQQANYVDLICPLETVSAGRRHGSQVPLRCAALSVEENVKSAAECLCM